MSEIAFDPLPEQVKAFLENHPDGEPVVMLNLLKFKPKATYRDGEEISGRKAYGRYGAAFSQMVAALKIDGAYAVFSGKIGSWLIGQGEANGMRLRCFVTLMPRLCLQRSVLRPTGKSISIEKPD